MAQVPVPRGFPILSNKFWGGKGDVCGYNMGVVPHSGEPHLEHLECTGKGLAMCLCCRSDHKDCWHCADEGSSPFHYFLWSLKQCCSDEKYPVNQNMTIKGEPVKGCVLVIKLETEPSNHAKPVDITLEEVQAIVAANPVGSPDSAPAPVPVARSAPKPKPVPKQKSQAKSGKRRVQKQ